MDNNSFLGKVKQEAASFLRAIPETSDTFYYVLLSFYLALFYVLKIAWNGAMDNGWIVTYLRYGLLIGVLWGSAVFLFSLIASWKKLWNNTLALILVCLGLLAITAYFSSVQTTNLFSFVFDAFFCLMAYKRDYKKILKCMLGVAVVMLLVSAIGVPLGFTEDLAKPNYPTDSHSLGIEYPNTWGYLVFMAMMMAWYLYLRFNPLVTFALFWATSLFMYNYISCHTIAVLTAVFPVLAFLVDLIEKRVDKKVEAELEKNPDSEALAKRPLSVGGWLVVAIPALILVFVLVVSFNVEWVYLHFYGTPLKNFAMRFVQTGLYFRTFGFRIIGNSYYSHSNPVYADVCGTQMQVNILDSSYGSYFVMRGILWVLCVTAWECMANYKGLKKRDYAIPFLCFILLIFATMERPGLEAWYNFTLLYPLAMVLSKPATPRVFELLDEPKQEEKSEQTETVEKDSAVPEGAAE